MLVMRGRGHLTRRLFSELGNVLPVAVPVAAMAMTRQSRRKIVRKAYKEAMKDARKSGCFSMVKDDLPRYVPCGNGRRIDPEDGKAYSFQELVEYYGTGSGYGLARIYEYFLHDCAAIQDPPSPGAAHILFETPFLMAYLTVHEMASLRTVQKHYLWAGFLISAWRQRSESRAAFELANECVLPLLNLADAHHIARSLHADDLAHFLWSQAHCSANLPSYTRSSDPAVCRFDCKSSGLGQGDLTTTGSSKGTPASDTPLLGHATHSIPTPSEQCPSTSSIGAGALSALCQEVSPRPPPPLCPPPAAIGLVVDNIPVCQALGGLFARPA